MTRTLPSFPLRTLGFGFAFLFALLAPVSAQQFGDFIYAELPGATISITAYTGTGGAVVVPAEIDGKPVVELGRSAFQEQTVITSITIPDTVAVIDSEAFDGCTGLAGIVLPTNLTTIGSNAFRGCHSLVGLTLPASLATIDSGAFSDCDALTSITVPAGVSTFGSAVFFDCTGLTSATLLNNVANLPDATFAACASLATIDLPPGVTTIGRNAFVDCLALSRIDLPPTVRTLSESCFSGCSTLTEIDISQVRSIAPRVFLLCRAFLNCSGLQTLTLPGNLTELGERVFAGCDSLTSILVEVGNQRFTSSGGVVFSADLTTLIQFPVGRVGVYSIPTDTETLGRAAFATCGLNSVTLSDSVQQVGIGVFEDCLSLQEILVDPGNSALASEEGVLFSIDGLELIQYPPARPGPYTLPSDLTTIANSAFATCPGIFDILIPETVTSIGERAFTDCPNLLTVYFAGDAPMLSFGAFRVPSPGFLAFHLESRPGFSEPAWESLPLIEIDDTAQAAASWLLRHGFPPNTSLGADPNRDQVDLLSGYAFDLDPHRNMQGDLPVPIVLPSRLDLSFQATSPGVSYGAETSTNAVDWTSNGVSLSDLDPSGRRTATVFRDSDRRFLRLRFSLHGPGTADLSEGALKASFESASVGDLRGYGEDGPTDNLAWWLAGGGSVQDEATLDNPPDAPGSALFLRDPDRIGAPTRLNLISENIDLADVPNEKVIASIDVRTFEDSSGSNYEEMDFVEAWLEGSVDGVHFSRFEGSAVIPLRTGRLDRRSVEATHPEADDLKKLELPDGRFTTFSTEANDPIPPEIRFLRVRLLASADSDSERIFVDNLCVGLRQD